MYIIYRYIDSWGDETGLELDANSQHVYTSHIRGNDASSFARELQSILKKYYNMEIAGKRVLDVGMGNGNVLYFVRELGADVFGVDINDYLDEGNYYEGRTFPETDVREIPEKLLGTFDVAYQRYFSVPFPETSEVLLAVSKCLKPNGIYIVTFSPGDDYYTHKDSFVLKILNEIYNKVEVFYEGDQLVASSPQANPTLTPMEEYYFLLTDEEFKKYNSNPNYLENHYGKEDKRLVFTYKK